MTRAHAGDRTLPRPGRSGGWAATPKPATWTRTPWTARRRVLGEDHPDTLASANNLAVDLRDLGEVQAARDLDQDTLDRRRRVLGEDHPDTLASASNLAADLRELGEVQAARDLDQDTLDRRRRVLGEDHPDTLASANNLAARPARPGRGAGRPRPGPRTPWTAAAGSWARTTPTP